MPEASPQGLFFAGSDDDEPPVVKSPSIRIPPTSSPETSSASRSSPRHPLFLEDSDDDNSMYTSPKLSPSPEKIKRPFVIEDEDSDIQNVKHSQVSTGNKKSDPYSRPTSLSPILGRKTLSPGPVSKKRRLLPEHESVPNLATNFLPTYLGEVIVPNAWSNVSGKGYVKPNEAVFVKREERNLPQAGKSKPKSTIVSSGKKKQISIATMLKPQPAKTSNLAKKKNTDNIVRLVNNKGFGDHHSYLSKSYSLTIRLA